MTCEKRLRGKRDRSFTVDPVERVPEREVPFTASQFSTAVANGLPASLPYCQSVAS